MVIHKKVPVKRWLTRYNVIIIIIVIIIYIINVMMYNNRSNSYNITKYNNYNELAYEQVFPSFFLFLSSSSS